MQVGINMEEDIRRRMYNPDTRRRAQKTTKQ